MRTSSARCRPHAALTCALSAAAPLVAAQESIRVEVTGSHIPRAELESALPVQVITAEEISRAGWNTVAELLASLPANLNGQNDALSIGNPNGGSSTANLRGLGDGNTLVLLNGRRLANYAYLSGTLDLATIPLAALDRVEILKDGASSVYGTDAIAGVINFITRRDFGGVEAAANVAIPQHGGAERYQATASAGWGDLAIDRYNVFVTLDWQKNEGLALNDRPFSRAGHGPGDDLVGFTFTAYPANVVVSPVAFDNPGLAAGCAPPVSVPFSGLFAGRPVTACVYDYRTGRDALPPTETLNAVSRATLQYAADHALFGEVVVTDRELVARIAPTPVTRTIGAQGAVPRYPRDGPYYPAEFAAEHGLTGDLAILYRLVTLGPRVERVDTRAWRVLVGGEGRLGDWDYDVAYLRSENEATTTFVRGWTYASRFLDVLATGLVNPWGEFGPEGQALLEGVQATGEVRSAKGTLDQVDARVAGAVARLPGGVLSAALGAEARREHLVDRPSAILDSGDVMSQPGSIDPQSASRRVQAAFAEALVPITETLEAQVALRVDHYSDFGNTTNPKLALRYQPAKTLLLRGAWGKGFRAPTLPDLFTPVSSSEGIAFYEDPVRCPVTQTPEDCGFGMVTTLSGGNPDLVPERSKQWTAGVVFEPARGASLGVDYWNIRKRNVIAALDPAFVYEHYDTYGESNILRGPPDLVYPGLPGPIEAVVAWNQNVGNNEATGLDVSLRLDSGASAAGRFKLTLDGTYIVDWTEHLDGLPARSVEGGYLLGPVPRWRHYAQVGWERGAWTVALGHRFQSGYRDLSPASSGEAARVGSYSLVDVQASWRGLRGTTLAAGVRNLADADPPFTNATGWGYDPSYADPRGRTFYARVAYAFR